MSKYFVIAGSQSGHCCFDWTVVDKSTPHEVYPDCYKAVCECFDEESAVMIAEALNAKTE